MDPLITELLRVYCHHPTQAIEATDGKLLLDAFAVVKPEALVAIPGYPVAFALVSECASIVDRLAAKHPAPYEQVRESLRMLRRMLDDGEPETKIDTARALVECRLRKTWPPAEQSLYDEKKQILEWRDFFVSYTNRDAPAINRQFRDLIKGCLGNAPKGNQANVNYLARVVTRHLRRYQQLSGFFDEDNLQVGENIQEAVEGYCTKAFAFVQLIEPLTFDKEPPRNWCFHEYKCFSENPAIVALMGDKNRHYFILTDPQLSAIKPAGMFPPYAGWVKRMDDLKQTHIALNNERNTTLRAKIKEIATQILKLRSEVIDRWLSYAG
jgi:hypothetical protein